MHHLEKDNSISSLDMIIYRLSFLSFKRIVKENEKEILLGHAVYQVHYTMF